MNVLAATLILAALTGALVPAAQADDDFLEIQITATGRDGHAHKTVTPDGLVQGGHLSGGPGGPRLFRSSGTLSAEDLARLRQQVAALLREPPPAGAADGGMAIEIRRADGSRLAFPAAASSASQALWDLIAAQRAGGW